MSDSANFKKFLRYQAAVDRLAQSANVSVSIIVLDGALKVSVCAHLHSTQELVPLGLDDFNSKPSELMAAKILLIAG